MPICLAEESGPPTRLIRRRRFNRLDMPSTDLSTLFAEPFPNEDSRDHRLPR